MKLLKFGLDSSVQNLDLAAKIYIQKVILRNYYKKINAADNCSPIGEYFTPTPLK